MKCRNLARGDLGCSKSSPTLSCRAPFLSCRAIARHPSLRSGRHPQGDPSAYASGRQKKGLGATFPPCLPRHASAEGPLASLGATRKGGSGQQKEAFGATKKLPSGRQQGGLHKNIFSAAQEGIKKI
jgi:hypothetical protein